MIKLTVNSSKPVTMNVPEGISLRDALISFGNENNHFFNNLNFQCGGKGTCGKCKVNASGGLSALTADEKKRLSEDEIKSGMRLACQVTLIGDASIIIPDRKKDNILITSTHKAAKNHPLFARYGIAVDIGTTTLVLRLLSKKGLEATAAARNPQAAFGSDVISRMAQALNGHAGNLQRLVLSAIDTLVLKACQKASVKPTAIDYAVLTGNTTMLHLLTGKDVAPLSRAPFIAEELFGCEINAGEIDIPSLSNARFYLPRCISAFVGADVTTAVLASDMTYLPISIMADLGTNGELALWKDGNLLCTSTAAGPAFEGAHIEHGMMAEEGAIDSVRVFHGQLVFTTIGNAPPAGICGSGLIDAISAGLELGMIEETGALPKGNIALAGEVALTQRDVRQIQLSKSAICAGLVTLMKSADINTSAVGCLFIAGGLGNSVSVVNAAAIGLIPQQLADRTYPIGNAALSGAEMILLDHDLIQKCDLLASNAEAIDLTDAPGFSDRYIDGMILAPLRV